MSKIRPGASSTRGAAHPKKEPVPKKEEAVVLKEEEEDLPEIEIIAPQQVVENAVIVVAPVAVKEEVVVITAPLVVKEAVIVAAPVAQPVNPVDADMASFVKNNFPSQNLTLVVGEDKDAVNAFGTILRAHGCEVDRYDTTLSSLKPVLEAAKDHASSMNVPVVLLGGYTPAGETVPLKCITGGTKARLVADQIFLLKDNSLFILKNRIGAEGSLTIPTCA